MSDTANAIRNAVKSAREPEPTLPSPPVRRALRIAAHLAQEQVAGPVGVSRVAISRYEAGTREPRGDVRRRYAEALEAMRDA